MHAVTGEPSTLLLFDIDGTLLQRASFEHAQAMLAAIARVHGVKVGTNIPGSSAAGRTDGEIARLLLRAHGVSDEAITAAADQVRQECCEIYSESCPESLAERVVPGIPKLLQELSTRPQLRLALVTGNYEQVARTKLAAAGIGHHFPPGVGGFGSDSEHRPDLPPLARRRAGTPELPWDRERTIVIGDTPRDIACARADGLRVIAVTTGPHDASELADADLVAENTTGLSQAIAAMAGGVADK